MYVVLYVINKFIDWYVNRLKFKLLFQYIFHIFIIFNSYFIYHLLDKFTNWYLNRLYLYYMYYIRYILSSILHIYLLSAITTIRFPLNGCLIDINCPVIAINQDTQATLSARLRWGCTWSRLGRGWNCDAITRAECLRSLNVDVVVRNVLTEQWRTQSDFS